MFSASGFTPIHPSVEEGESHSNYRPSGLNLNSSVRIRPDCPGTVVCTVGDDGEEDDVRLGDRPNSDGSTARESTALIQRGRGVAFRCAPAQTCSNFSVEWFVDDELSFSGSFSTDGEEDAILNADLVVWSHDRLWANGTGPWIRSPEGCLSCRVEACGTNETASMCGTRQTVKRTLSPTFSSAFWYVVYALFIVYITN